MSVPGWESLILADQPPDAAWRAIFARLRDAALGMGGAANPAALHRETIAPDRILAESAWDLWQSFPTAAPTVVDGLREFWESSSGVAGTAVLTLVSRIVANTNWQNAINYADLVSNDRVQIETERALRKVGYMYLRKRQKKSEARSAAGKTFIIIKKDELAQAVAACEMDPVIVREGKNNLFGEHYKAVFPNTDANFYLSRYWARKHVGLASRGKPQRAYAKWLALHFIWSRLGPLLNKDEPARRYRSLSERKDAALCKPLMTAINVAFEEVLAYYDSNKGSGETVVDHSTFFRNKKGRHLEFQQFWKNEATKTDKFDAAWMKVEQALS